MNILNLETDNYSENAVKKLKKIGNYYVLENFKKKNYYLIDAVITRLKYLIDKNFLNKFPNLKFILCNTTGIDHINL
jgi:lactate dehydrogenase-like 2-hydroxyacid dehydrogenase